MPHGPTVITLTIYSRPGCHLCEEMKAVVERVVREMPGQFALDEVDISANPDLEAQYRLEIPVLAIEGTKVAKYRITARELARAISARQL
jgi:thioredoxin-like negative regulator of GroEL